MNAAENITDGTARLGEHLAVFRSRFASAIMNKRATR